MKQISKLMFALTLGVFSLQSGCGYTTQVKLPVDAKTIYVKTVKNEVNVTRDYPYVQGLEIQITNAIIKRLQQDGTLRVVDKDDADVILESNLIDYQQQGLRFTSLEQVEEFRLFIIMAVRLVDSKTKDSIWQESNFSGDAEYFVSDIRSLAREEATTRAVERLARNVVDRIVDDW